MNTFRKKPVLVFAKQFLPHENPDVFRFQTDTMTLELPVLVDQYKKNPHLQIHTLEGIHTASPGDWIIQGVKGEFYPCKPDIFEQTYEPVQKQKH